ncbi:hypothetical protein RCN05_14110 [Escherichia coli]|nr:hypothetical protein [Escherichia coli]
MNREEMHCDVVKISA